MAYICYCYSNVLKHTVTDYYAIFKKLSNVIHKMWKCKRDYKIATFRNRLNNFLDKHNINYK